MQRIALVALRAVRWGCGGYGQGGRVAPALTVSAGRDIPGHTGTYRDIPGHTGTYRDIPGHTGTYRDIPGHTGTGSAPAEPVPLPRAPLRAAGASRLRRAVARLRAAASSQPSPRIANKALQLRDAYPMRQPQVDRAVRRDDGERRETWAGVQRVFHSNRRDRRGQRHHP